MKFERLGWILAAALAGGIGAVGFQGANEKYGSVDLAKVFNDSDIAHKQTDTLHNMAAVRLSVLQFLQQNIHMKPDEAKKFRDLSLKDPATMAASEKTELDRIKADALLNESNFLSITQKPSPTPADQTLMQEQNTRKDANAQLFEEWRSTFKSDLDTKQLSLHDDTMVRVKDAVKEVAKKQGYTVVYAQEFAPYTANDLTADVLKQVNSGKG